MIEHETGFLQLKMLAGAKLVHEDVSKKLFEDVSFAAHLKKFTEAQPFLTSLKRDYEFLLNPTTLCPGCQTQVPMGKGKLWVVQKKPAKVIKIVNVADGTEFNGWNVAEYARDGKFLHPHVSIYSRLLCMGNSTSAVNLLCAGLNDGSTYFNMSNWFNALGHDCKWLQEKCLCGKRNNEHPVVYDLIQHNVSFRIYKFPMYPRCSKQPLVDTRKKLFAVSTTQHTHLSSAIKINPPYENFKETFECPWEGCGKGFDTFQQHIDESGWIVEYVYTAPCAHPFSFNSTTIQAYK